MKSRMQRKLHVRFGGRAGQTHHLKAGRAPRSDPTQNTPPGNPRSTALWRRDVFNRRGLGWSIDNSATSGLVTTALEMTIGNRLPNPGTVIHSDQGAQMHLLGVHPTGSRIRSGPFHENRRELFRQHHNGVALGPNTGRAVGPPAPANPYRTRQRYLQST